MQGADSSSGTIVFLLARRVLNTGETHSRAWRVCLRAMMVVLWFEQRRQALKPPEGLYRHGHSTLDMPSRRTLLATFTAATGSVVAGCTGDGTLGAGPTDGQDGDFPRIEIGEYSIPEEWGLDVHLPVARQFTEDHPARIGIIVTNVADEKQELRFGPMGPFDGLAGHHTEEDATLMLFPEDGHGYSHGEIPDEPVDGCWLPPEIHFAEMTLRFATLQPGESVSTAYDIYAGSTAEPADGCMAPGAYEFETADFSVAGFEGFQRWSFPVMLKK